MPAFVEIGCAVVLAALIARSLVPPQIIDLCLRLVDGMCSTIAGGLLP